MSSPAWLTAWKDHLSWVKLDRFAPMVLFVLIVWMSWVAAALLWLFLAPPQAPVERQVALGGAQQTIPNITSFALFEEQANQVAEQKTMSSVPMILNGVFVSSPRSRSAAVIKLEDRADRYRINEQIGETDYHLAQVYWDRVVLASADGESIVLHIGEMLTPDHSAPNAPSHSAPPANQTPGTSPTVDQGLSNAVQQMKTNRSDFAQKMGLKSNSKKGGYVVTENSPSDLRNRLGLRAGDQIVSVNGQAVGQGQTDVQILEQARQQKNVEIQIRRGQQTMTIHQNF